VDNKRHLERIKKLLNLARSSNSNEAANALGKAQALMRKHEVDLDDVALSDIGSTKSTIQGVRPPGWVLNLLGVVEASFGVKSLIGRKLEFNSYRDSGSIEFVGRKPNDEIASFCFDVLYYQLLRHRKQFISSLHKNCKRITKRNRADWYCMGWVSEVEAKVSRLVVPNEDKTSIDLWVERKYGDLSMYSARSNIEDKAAASAFHQGRSDGTGVNLNAGVSGRRPGKIGDYS